MANLRINGSNLVYTGTSLAICNFISAGCCGDDCSTAPKYLQVTLSNSSDASCKFCIDDVYFSDLEGTYVLEYVDSDDWTDPSDPLYGYWPAGVCDLHCRYGNPSLPAYAYGKIIKQHDAVTYGPCFCDDYYELDRECLTEVNVMVVTLTAYICNNGDVIVQLSFHYSGIYNDPIAVVETGIDNTDCGVCDEIETNGVSDTGLIWARGVMKMPNFYDDETDTSLCTGYLTATMDVDVEYV